MSMFMSMSSEWLTNGYQGNDYIGEYSLQCTLLSLPQLDYMITRDGSYRLVVAVVAQVGVAL